MSNEENHKEIKQLLRQAVSPVKNAELQRDLWPQMLRRLDQQPLSVPWFDWALAAILGAVLFFFPGTIPALLYHL
ncbi:MAG TPA: hypothetical protein VFN26_14250 [Candidatus Acidoferrum sp.]|nr:hypothetical protein [Candidatus Acidoferrum sp.]